MEKLFLAVWVFINSLFGANQHSTTPNITPQIVSSTATPIPSYNCEQVKGDLDKAYNTANPHSLPLSENIFYFKVCVTPTVIFSLTPTGAPFINNPHAGMKEIKGTNCSGQMGTNGGKDINMDCQPYDYWYNPNATPEPLPSDMLQSGSIPPLDNKVQN
jgi:hypothetical protein